MCVVFFAAGVSAVNAGLDAWLPQVFPAPIQAKIDHLRGHPDDYDLLFIGSSHIDRHIDPRLFDRELAASGHSVKSFNLGIPGMGSYEADRLLDHVLDLELPALRWVIVDTDRPSYALLPGDLRSERSVWWHTIEQTRTVIGATLIQKISAQRKADVIAAHLEHLLWRVFHVGMGPRYLWGPSRRAPEALEATRGFRETRERPSPAFAKRRGEYEERLARLLEDSDAGTLASRPYAPLYRSQARRFRARGVTPVYLLGALLDRSPEVHEMAERGDLPELLNYDDPHEYPELYAFDVRFNEDHLRGSGAQIFTRQLAHDFGRFLEAE